MNKPELKVYPSDLVVGRIYVWKMGAEDLPCVYKGKIASMSYLFQLDKAEHVLSYGDVIRWIENKEKDFYESPDMCCEV